MPIGYHSKQTLKGIKKEQNARMITVHISHLGVDGGEVRRVEVKSGEAG